MNASARDRARWTSDKAVRVDHVALTDADLEWLSPAHSVTAWAVRVQGSLWSKLPMLERLDIRGGSGTSADQVAGCASLRWLQINQVRGLSDLKAISGLNQLEFLSLYGLPQVRELPSLAPLTRLRFVWVGSMKGLQGLGGVLDAPNLEQLTLARRVALDSFDADRIADHQSIRAFTWFAEDVPDKVWVPVVERIAKPPTTVDWLTWPLPSP